MNLITSIILILTLFTSYSTIISSAVYIKNVEPGIKYTLTYLIISTILWGIFNYLTHL